MPDDRRVLPKCVLELQSEIDEFEKLLLDRSFPELTLPATDAEVREIVARARAWASAIHKVHTASRKPLIRHFDSGKQRVSLEWRERPFDFKSFSPGFSAELRGNQPKLVLGMARTWKGSLCVHPQLNGPGTAASYLGEIPGRLGDSGVTFLVGDTVPLNPNAIQNLAGQNEDIELTVENWPAVRESLELGYITIISKCLGLVDWVRDRIEALESSLFPKIDFSADLERGSIEVTVRFRGISTKRKLTQTTRDFLESLATAGKATTLREHKRQLLVALPELRPWIRTVPVEPKATEYDYTQCGTYTLPEEVGGRIKTAP